MKLLYTLFMCVFCLATVVLAILQVFEIPYSMTWETIYTVTGLSAMLLFGLLAVVARMRKQPRKSNVQEEKASP